MFMLKLESMIELKRVKRVEGGEESGLEMRCQECPSLQLTLQRFDLIIKAVMIVR